MSYTQDRSPTYAYLDPALGNRAVVWTVVWVWPEKTGFATYTRCLHRHRDHSRAIECAKTRCDEVRP